MDNDVIVVNIRDYLCDEELGEKALNQLLSGFLCYKNPGVERFLKEQSVEFAKKNQSVTYLVISGQNAELMGYFTLTVKPIRVKADKFSNSVKRKLSRTGEFDKNTGSYTMAAYLIAQIGKNYANKEGEPINGDLLMQSAVNTIKRIQYMIGGMVVFVEAEDNEKLMHIYEVKNGFNRFAVRQIQTKKDDSHKLVQLLKIL